MTAAMLRLSKVDKFYGPVGKGVHAVKAIDLDVGKGEIIALLGSSGCGKTSTLRMIAGFEDVSRGSVSLNGRDIHRLPPVQRNVAMAFEGYSLYLPLTVRDNIAFALKSSNFRPVEVDARVASVAGMLEITDILGRYPSGISGGQQQRASLARALIRDADLHLLDEPMGQLEPQLRTILRGRIKHFIKERGLTVILVTHDQTEANALADRIAVMEAGELQQFATPEDIRLRPANLFTGTFIGEPPMNVFPASVHIAGGRLVLDLSGARFDLPAAEFGDPVANRLAQASSVVVGVRPHAVHRIQGGLPATVITNQWLGDQSHIAANFAGGTVVLVEHDRAGVAEGDRIGIALRSSDLHFFDPADGRAISHGRILA
jgi:multiple sugar transport system ATP-binding protein